MTLSGQRNFHLCKNKKNDGTATCGGCANDQSNSIATVECVAYWDRLWADMQRGMPQPSQYETYNDYCRAMDDFTLERNHLLEREGREACEKRL